jgi:hypothetical protein
MYEYKIGDLALMLGALSIVNRDLGTSDTLQQPICTDDFCNNLSLVLNGLAILCDNFDADPSLLEQIKTLEGELIEGKADRRESVLRARLDGIGKSIENNLNARKFMFMPADHASYWNNPEIFGKYFILSFPEAASFEMLEVGKCFAAARGTACVFHCMRVAEYGLRKLARQLRVTIGDHGKKCPLEYGDWNKVITAVRNKISKIRQQPAGPKREKVLQYYSSAADQCEYLKDIWRNELMHTRRFYSKSETLGVINRVRDFIEPFLLKEKDANKELEKRWRKMLRNQQSNEASGDHTARKESVQTAHVKEGEKTQTH